MDCLYFNPRSPHRERRLCGIYTTANLYFNPRSPHRERRGSSPHEHHRSAISIHAPLTGSDFIERHPVSEYLLFQSTLPSQGATTTFHKHPSVICISIHAPLTGSDIEDVLEEVEENISIHAPLTGSDQEYENIFRVVHRISIHAPLTGSDSKYTHKIPL